MKQKLSPEEMKLKRQFHIMAIRDEIDALTYLENIQKEKGKRARSPEENTLFIEVGRAYYGRRQVFGMMAEEAARSGDDGFFKLVAKYLAKIKSKEQRSEPFTLHVMWALVFVFNNLVDIRPEPTKREVIEFVRSQLKSRNITPMDASDEGWKNVWRASVFLSNLKQARTGSAKYHVK